jgi:hypothetical protein
LAHECSPHPLFVSEAVANSNRLQRHVTLLNRLTGCLDAERFDELAGSHSGMFNAIARECPQTHTGSLRQDLGPQICPQIIGDPSKQILQRAFGVRNLAR